MSRAAAAATSGHCPFLDRDDPRCAQHFGVNHLDYAFGHCVGDYRACPAYASRRAEALAAVARGPMFDRGASAALTVTVPVMRDLPVSPQAVPLTLSAVPLTLKSIPLTLRGRHVVVAVRPAAPGRCAVATEPAAAAARGAA